MHRGEDLCQGEELPQGQEQERAATRVNCKRRGEEIREEANRRATRTGENDSETRRRVRKEEAEARQKIVVRLLNVEGLTEIKLRARREILHERRVQYYVLS